MCSKRNRRFKSKCVHTNINVNLMVKSVIQVKREIAKMLMRVQKASHIWKKIFGILLHVAEKKFYLVSIIEDSVITCDEIIDAEETVTVTTNLMKKKQRVKQNFYILIAVLLITIALLIAFSIYCYMVKLKSKQNHLSAYYFTNTILIIYI